MSTGPGVGPLPQARRGGRDHETGVGRTTTNGAIQTGWSVASHRGSGDGHINPVPGDCEGHHFWRMTLVAVDPADDTDQMPSPRRLSPDQQDDSHGAVVTGLRVVLAEDDVLLREGLASLLERSGLQVVGQAGDGVRLMELVREQSPDLVVVDIRMPPTRTTEGLLAAQAIRAEHPEVAIRVLTARVEVEHAVELFAGG